MSDSVLDFHFRQAVGEDELDLAFELLENADRNLASDLGVFGIIQGAEPTQHSPVPDVSIDLTAPARAYDHLGQRIFFATDQTVDCSQDYTGIPTEVPTAGEERWLGVFLKFGRLLSDPRTDGNSQQVFFRRDESFRVVVRQGPPGPEGMATKVPLQPDELLVCDVLRRHGQTQILEPDIDTSRRQAFISAHADHVDLVAGEWQVIEPPVANVQAALDNVDSVLHGHLTGDAPRHSASHIELAPHGLVTKTDVGNGIHELVDKLESAATGSPGSVHVGADQIPGTPHALQSGTVDGQLSQILAWLNAHLSAISGAHNASALTATTHNWVQGTSVQAQLAEVVAGLLSQDAASSGATRVGAGAVAGEPAALAAGTVTAQLGQLLSALNAHANSSADAHSAAAVGIADEAGNLDAGNVEAALSEILGAFAHDHFRGDESSPGEHRTISQPTLGEGRVLLWDSRGVGTPQARFRVHADQDSIWFTVNAAWNGSAWQRDAEDAFSGGFRFSHSVFEICHDDSSGPSFLDWSTRFSLLFGAPGNSNFLVTGSVRANGRVAIAGTNASSESRDIMVACPVTYRSRFVDIPSSITLSKYLASDGWEETPNTILEDEDGFVCYAEKNANRGQSIYWFGEYETIA